jgi:hypothetical protein
MFINKCKNVRKWGTPASTFDQGAAVDANGDPTEDFGAFWDNQLNVSGLYKFSCNTDGVPVLTAVQNCTITNQVFAAGVLTADITIDKPTGTEFSLSWKVTGTLTGAQNIKMIKPGYADDSQIFTNEIKAFVAPFRVIRYMDLLETNDSETTDWNTQQQESASTYSGGKGVNMATVVKFANFTKKHLWINIPHKATDDYLTNLKTLLEGTLDPTLHVWIEWSNEVWNGIFDQFQDNIDAAQAEITAGDVQLNDNGAITNTFYLGRRRVAKMLMHAQSILGTSSQFRYVLAGQFVDTSVVQKGLDYITKYFGPPKNYIHSIAVATYYNCGKDAVLGADIPANYIAGSYDAGDVAANPTKTYQMQYEAKSAALTSQNFLDRLSVRTDQGLGSSFFVAHKAIATSLGVGLAEYEGGLDLKQFNVNVAAKIAADTDPQMQPITNSYMTSVIRGGVTCHCYFSSTGKPTFQGFWELTQDPHDLQQPKYLGWRSAVGV